jgi:hypothetical protein
MEKTEAIGRSFEQPTWEEESGLLAFLARVYAEVARFDRTFDFGISTLPSLPADIDGKKDLLRNIGFVVVRHNSAVVGRDYCLYSVLRGRALFGSIGIYTDGIIETVRELKPMTEFRNGTAVLHDWLRALVKASCDKI